LRQTEGKRRNAIFHETAGGFFAARMRQSSLGYYSLILSSPEPGSPSQAPSNPESLLSEKERFNLW
jgi:hypothetical protein